MIESWCKNQSENGIMELWNYGIVMRNNFIISNNNWKEEFKFSRATGVGLWWNKSDIQESYLKEYRMHLRTHLWVRLNRERVIRYINFYNNQWFLSLIKKYSNCLYSTRSHVNICYGPSSNIKVEPIVHLDVEKIKFQAYEHCKHNSQVIN
jgi:hypothetical protein